jgi:hypothetical protein
MKFWLKLFLYFLGYEGTQWGGKEEKEERKITSRARVSRAFIFVFRLSTEARQIPFIN